MEGRGREGKGGDEITSMLRQTRTREEWAEHEDAVALHLRFVGRAADYQHVGYWQARFKGRLGRAKNHMARGNLPGASCGVASAVFQTLFCSKSTPCGSFPKRSAGADVH